MIATNATPIDTSSGFIRVSEVPDVFVFDSIGRFAHYPGSQPSALAPKSVRFSLTPDGQVVLSWTNGSPTPASYQLERAAGSGAYAALGTSMPGSTTSAIDGTAVAGGTYHYRLKAVDASGVTSYSNVVSVTLTDIGLVTRTTSGLLFRDQFDRADGPPGGAGWTIESGGWTIANNALQINVLTGQNLTLRLAALPDRRDYHVQLLTSRSQLANYAPIQVRKAFNMMYQADLGSTSEAGGVPRLYRLNGWWNGMDTAPLSLSRTSSIV